MIYCKGTFFSNTDSPVGNQKKMIHIIVKVDGFIMCGERDQWIACRASACFTTYEGAPEVFLNSIYHKKTCESSTHAQHKLNIEL